jgi:hypothetical protein
MNKLAFAAFALLPAVAPAHFMLDTPPSWMSQDSSGSPQKQPPCGNEAGGTPSGIVTTFIEGQTITVQVTEIIFHPGHYRVAIAPNQGALPAEPDVDAGGGMACGTVSIFSPPYALPILADDVFSHVEAFTGPQSVQIQLPVGFTCDNCTLQIIEFMSDHGLNPVGGCFYHHCAQVTVLPADSGYDAGPPPPSDAGSGGTDSGNPGGSDSGGPDGATGPGGDGGASAGTSTGSCGCTGGASGASLAALLALALLRLASSRRVRQRA